jgi:hypothetical protein
MNGERNRTPEESFLIAETSPDEKWKVYFEDDGATGYLYIVPVNENGEAKEILDHLWIYNQISPPIRECREVFVLWKEDSSKAAIIVDDECWGMFDLKTWRKINSPRKENEIISLPYDIWERPLNENEGEPMKTNVSG